MKRRDLEHVLRAASRIADESDVLVIGSQSILGSIDDSDLPREAAASIEVDVTFFDDHDDEKSDAVDRASARVSSFRHPDAADRRRNVVELTDEGLVTFDRALAARDAAER